MQNSKALRELRQKLFDNGYQPVAVKEKRPTQKNWTNLIGLAGFDHKAPNTGILTRGLQVIDIDCDDVDVVEKIKAVTVDILGGSPLTRFRENSPRVCLLYRAQEGEPEKRSCTIGAGKVEVLGRGQQFVAYGQHPSGVQYRWIAEAPHNVQFNQLPVVTNEQIDTLFERLDIEFGNTKTKDSAKNQLSSIIEPVEFELSHDKTKRLFAQILSGESYHDPLRDLAAQFASDGVLKDRITAILCAVMDNAKKVPSPAEPDRWVNRYNQIPSLSKTAVVKYGKLQSEVKLNGKPRFVLEPWSSIKFDPANDNWLIEGLLPPEGLAVIYGQQKNYKSFVASDVALAISRGVDWGSKKVLQGPVVYIAGEGVGGFRKRIEGYRAHHNLQDADLPFYLVAARPNLGTAGGDVIALTKAIEEALGTQKPRLIVLDTLARMLAGQNENGDGMQCFIDNAETLADHFGCLSIAVHHSGKSSDGGVRGHSSLPAAAVAVWCVKKSDNLKATITIENAKDEEDGNGLNVDLKIMEFEFIEGCTKVPSTLVVEKVHFADSISVANSKRTKRVPQGLKMYINSVEQALAMKGENIKPFDDCGYVKAARKNCILDIYSTSRNDEIQPESRIKAFKRDFKKAIDQLLIRSIEINGTVWVWKA